MKNKIKPAMRCKPAAGNIPDRESPTAHSDRPHICTWATPPTGCSPRVTECTGEAKGRPRPLMVTLVSPRTPPLSLPSTAGRQTGRQDTSTQPSHTLSFLPGPKAPPALPSSLHTFSQALVLWKSLHVNLGFYFSGDLEYRTPLASECRHPALKKGSLTLLLLRWSLLLASSPYPRPVSPKPQSPRCWPCLCAASLWVTWCFPFDPL